MVTIQEHQQTGGAAYTATRNSGNISTTTGGFRKPEIDFAQRNTKDSVFNQALVIRAHPCHPWFRPGFLTTDDTDEHGWARIGGKRRFFDGTQVH